MLQGPNRDGYASHTGQQELVVAFPLYAFCVTARGKAPKEPPNCSSAVRMLAGSRRRLCAHASRNRKNQALCRLAMLSHRTGYVLACRARGRHYRTSRCASFAVLVAEELFASGCRLLVSLTSAGQVVASGPPPYFVIVDRALCDEGTSYHDAAPTDSPRPTHGLSKAPQRPLPNGTREWSSAPPGRRTRRFARRPKR
jgi:hypothetical protein